MAKNDIDVSINEVYESIEDTIAKEMTKKIINLFIDNGLTYKIKIGYGNVYRIFCYIKKSKEALIINTIGKNFGPFELQLRIKNKSTLEKLESFSTNVRDMILSGKDCFGQRCCNCGSEYKFSYLKKEYRKCHMLCDNFYFRNLKLEDIDSIMDIMQDEIAYDMPKSSFSKIIK